MAGSRNRTVYDYFFRETKGPHLAQKWNLNYEIAKIAVDGDGSPENTYHVWGDNLDSLVCDCPAAYHHASRGPCKHVQWLLRWLSIVEDQKKKSNYRLTPVYYSASADSFYELPTDHLEDQIDDMEG